MLTFDNFFQQFGKFSQKVIIFALQQDKIFQKPPPPGFFGRIFTYG